MSSTIVVRLPPPPSMDEGTQIINQAIESTVSPLLFTVLAEKLASTTRNSKIRDILNSANRDVKELLGENIETKTLAAVKNILEDSLPGKSEETILERLEDVQDILEDLKENPDPGYFCETAVLLCGHLVDMDKKYPGDNRYNKVGHSVYGAYMAVDSYVRYKAAGDIVVRLSAELKAAQEGYKSIKTNARRIIMGVHRELVPPNETGKPMRIVRKPDSAIKLKRYNKD